ncbi:CBF/Mak21 family-domain-containing protein [Clohesyomyces aquaticus]|uniref:CBF/Mak21 family-domain-containing protein n=1 Tax=Clohesyomyces aquaticus TaxID=1231657 RepID=A0A1Y1ZWF4_9PLEO|nr:CBF/Mak21 family-domain-containing protein [Clohesyomyces aquaticus]
MAGVKRKREPTKEGRKSVKTKTRAKSPADDDVQATILGLEAQILESRRHLNNIATLLQLAKQFDREDEATILAAVALCRIFSRLLAAGDMVKSRGLPQSEVVIVQWLKERYREYVDMLLLEEYLRSETASKQSVALTLLMRLVKEESQTSQHDYSLKHGPLSRIIETVLLLPKDDATRDEFVEKYLKHFDDIRYYTFQTIGIFLESSLEKSARDHVSVSSLSMLLALDTIPSSKGGLENFYMGAPKKATSPLYSLSSYKSQAQAAWLVTLRSGLDKEQRKTVLRVFSHQIAPWFQQPEMLMDFLTDSYDVGGATSLLALSGLFYLMSERNLDYPSFYQRLYSLLDQGLLHSKHRSRFFRLLDTFMSSTHLPAAMVASFIKRLARLALNGPPAGIVVVIPWIYNMFKRHPACTFMIHREVRDPAIKQELKEEGMDDPFDMEEKDPMLSEAIESSLWEIESLQSHYHPNVATLAKIISEQFTKRSYNLEDFLDHSYTALLDNELSRELKKEPVVEFEIPKRIFTTDEGGLGPFGQLMSQVIESSA